MPDDAPGVYEHPDPYSYEDPAPYEPWRDAPPPPAYARDKGSLPPHMSFGPGLGSPLGPYGGTEVADDADEFPSLGFPPVSSDGYGFASPSRRRTGAVVTVIGAAVAVTLVVVVVALYALRSNGPSHTLFTPPMAAGLHRDTAAESRVPALAQQRVRLRRLAGGKLKQVDSAVYRRGDSTTPAATQVVFFGALATDGIDVNGFAAEFGSSARRAGDTVTNVAAGRLGGKAVCVQRRTARERSVACLWVDEDTFGEIVPATPMSAASAAALMRRMRVDIEQHT